MSSVGRYRATRKDGLSMKINVKTLKATINNLLRNTKGAEAYFKAYGENAIITVANRQCIGAAKIEVISAEPNEEFAISGKFLSEMLGSLDSDEVVIQKKDNMVEVKGGRSRWSLVALSNVAPTYTPVKSPEFVLGFSEDRYKEIMARAVPFVATEETISAFNGVSVVVDGDKCSIYGATRSCFSRQTFRISEAVEEKKVVVLWREIAALSLPSDVQWRFSTNTVEVVSGNERYTMPLLVAAPPAFEKVIPDLSNAKSVILPKGGFFDAVERVGLCARVVESSAIHMTLNDQTVNFYACSEMIGDAEESVATLNRTGIDGEKVGVSARLIEKIVKAASAVKVKMTYAGNPLWPLLFENDSATNDSDVEWLAVVAPVRLKN